jgi:type II secretory pathway component GspD/PulD (secretin)
VNLLFPPNTQVPIDQVLLKIKSDTGITVTPAGAARGQPIPAPLLKDATVEDVLNWIKAQKDWVWYKERATGNYIICDRQYYEKNVLTQNVVQLVIHTENIPAADAQKAVERMITPNVGSITSDPRTNNVFVTDLLPVAEAIERTIKMLDKRVFLRVFTLKHADPKTVLDIIQDYKSAPGRLDLVPKMRQIIAEDTYENIQRMEVMVDILDRGPEMRIYDLNNLDFEGKSVDDIKDYLDKEVITENAYLKFDKQNGVMILIDLPSVHEKVQKILAAVDRPARQIYIQAEIVETNFSHSFTIGTKYEFAHNIFVPEPTAATPATPATPNPIASPPPVTGTQPAVPPNTPSAPKPTLDFMNVAEAMAKQAHESFPHFTLGGSGLTLDLLSRQARINFKAVMEDSETKVLAQPRILVKNRESADITDGGTISYATTSYYGGGGYGGQPTQGGYNYPYVPSVGSGTVPIGITLTVDPSIMNNALVEMRVTLNNSTGTPVDRELGGQKYTLVDTTNQTINTILVVPDGQTRMIGGMIRNSETKSVNGIPFLKDIPIIGGILFGSTSQSPVNRRTLLMFITPTIVQEQARKYVVPPDEDEKTPPTFYQQATWSAAAVKRAMEQAFKEAEAKYPGGKVRPRETEETKGPTALPLPIVKLEHTSETKPGERPTPPPLPVEEERVSTAPQQMIPPLEPVPPPAIEPRMTAPPTSGPAPALPAPPPATIPAPALPAPPTSPTLKLRLPQERISTAPATPVPPPAKTPSPTKESTAATTPTDKGAAPTSSTPTPAPPRKTTPKTTTTSQTKSRLSPPAPLPGTSDRARTASPTIETGEEAGKTIFPTSGTVMLETTPVPVYLSGRRPADLPEPRPGAAEVQASAGSKPGVPGEEGPEISSYEIPVLGPDGRMAMTLPGGQRIEPPALGSLQIPMETLAAVATPSVAGAPAGAAAALLSGQPMAGRPGGPLPAPPPGATTGRPQRPPTAGAPSYGATPYGARPGIAPPGYPPGGPGSRYRRGTR